MSTLSTVITADIVNSGITSPQQLAKRLEESICSAQPEAIVFFYRGDSFQVYVPNAFEAYRLALKLRIEAILFENSSPAAHTDLRISIGIGTVSLPITELATAQGEAFVLSGRGFDALEKTDRRLKMHCSHIPSRIALEAISLFTDYLFRSLTIKQAAVLNHLLDHRTQFETALLLKKSQSTVNKHARNMGWRQMEELMDLYDNCIQQIKQHG